MPERADVSVIHCSSAAAPHSSVRIHRGGAVGCGGVDDRVLLGSAHGDVGELASASSGEDVGAITGEPLGAVNRDGVAVVEVVAVDAVAGDLDV